MKNKFLNFRVSESEYKELKLKANLAQMTNAQFLRSTLKNSIVHQVNKSHQKRVLFLFSNATNNLNQIAHYANIHKKLDNKILNSLDENLKYLKSLFLNGELK
jgi:phosphopantothenoylcysteine synthetase/decarboxylase